MINYGIIQKSIDVYEKDGFQRIESPWTVTSAISDITKPEGANEFTITEKNKVLVASGEQSFLYLYTKGFLPRGRFQTVTPCFRDEAFTPFHTKYFIKNELIITDDTSKESLRFIVNCARDFFRSYCLKPKINNYYVYSTSEKDDVIIVKNENGKEVLVDEVDVAEAHLYPQYDLKYRGIELGSYGIRRCDYLTWIYGTGVAEPRLSRTLLRYGISF